VRFLGYTAVFFAAAIGNTLFMAITLIATEAVTATFLSWLPYRAKRWLVSTVVGFCSTFGVLWVMRWLFGVIAGPESYGLGVFAVSLAPLAAQAFHDHRKIIAALGGLIDGIQMADGKTMGQIVLKEMAKKAGLPLPGELMDQNIAQIVAAIVFWKLHF
jgi:hypothetical protein